MTPARIFRAAFIVCACILISALIASAGELMALIFLAFIIALAWLWTEIILSRQGIDGRDSWLGGKEKK